MGSIYLFSDVLPNKCMNMLQMMHNLNADKQKGIDLLQKASNTGTMRRILAINCLLSYNLAFLQYVGPISDYSHSICEENVTYLINDFKQFFITDYFAGQFYKADNHDKCEKSLMAVSSLSYAEPVLLHVKLIGNYELMWFYAYDFNWADAFDCAARLATQTLWSRSYFIYLAVLFKSCLIGNDIEILDLVNSCQDLDKIFSCADSQIKPISADRLAAKRIKDLQRTMESVDTLNFYPVIWFILEAMYWHDEFRGWSEQSRGDLMGVAERIPGLLLLAEKKGLMMEGASYDKGMFSVCDPQLIRCILVSTSKCTSRVDPT